MSRVAKKGDSPRVPRSRKEAVVYSRNAATQTSPGRSYPLTHEVAVQVADSEGRKQAMDDMPESAPGPLFPIEAQVEDAERWRQRYEDVEAKYEAGVVAENHLRDEVEALSNKIDELQQHVASAGWGRKPGPSFQARQLLVNMQARTRSTREAYDTFVASLQAKLQQTETEFPTFPPNPPPAQEPDRTRRKSSISSRLRRLSSKRPSCLHIKPGSPRSSRSPSSPVLWHTSSPSTRVQPVISLTQPTSCKSSTRVLQSDRLRKGGEPNKATDAKQSSHPFEWAAQGGILRGVTRLEAVVIDILSRACGDSGPEEVDPQSKADDVSVPKCPPYTKPFAPFITARSPRQPSRVGPPARPARGLSRLSKISTRSESSGGARLRCVSRVKSSRKWQQRRHRAVSRSVSRSTSSVSSISSPRQKTKASKGRDSVVSWTSRSSFDTHLHCGRTREVRPRCNSRSSTIGKTTATATGRADGDGSCGQSHMQFSYEMAQLHAAAQGSWVDILEYLAHCLTVIHTKPALESRGNAGDSSIEEKHAQAVDTLRQGFAEREQRLTDEWAQRAKQFEMQLKELVEKHNNAVAEGTEVRQLLNDMTSAKKRIEEHAQRVLQQLTQANLSNVISSNRAELQSPSTSRATTNRPLQFLCAACKSRIVAKEVHSLHDHDSIKKNALRVSDKVGGHNTYYPPVSFASTPLTSITMEQQIGVVLAEHVSSCLKHLS